MPFHQSSFHLNPLSCLRTFLLCAGLVVSTAATTTARAQSSCSSDGQAAPTGLLERFISADCETCWADSRTVRAQPGELTVDWIVPSDKGEDAPLSTVASRDASQRLQALRQVAPKDFINVRKTVTAKPLTLRVARGLAFGGYMGVSIELTAAPGASLPTETLTAWLLLVQEIPVRTEGTPVPRYLARNGLVSLWDKRIQLSNKEQNTDQAQGEARLYESRPMGIPAGANPDHLHVLGWVENEKGEVIAAAVSGCEK
jgi:hypothetical protein